MINSANKIGRYNNIYRGYVLWNIDPLYKGRIKVFVPGVYPSQYASSVNLLPWALPAMPSFGGGSPNQGKCLNGQTGWSSVPHAGDIKTGSQVFIFFEDGDINHPVYFAVSQSGDGWLAEHQNQHVFQSDNVRIRIEQNLTSQKSSCKFDSFTSQQSLIAKKSLKNTCEDNSWSYDSDNGTIKQLPSRIDIQIEASDYSAVNLNIHGNVNMHIDGDWITEHIGNRYQYHKGDTYIKNQGGIYFQQYGTIVNSLSGNISENHIGNHQLIRNGNLKIINTGLMNLTVTQDVNINFNSNYNLNVGINQSIFIKENLNEIIGNNRTTTISTGNDTLNIILGSKNETVALNYSLQVEQNISISSSRGNILVQTLGKFPLMSEGSVTVEGFKNIGKRGNIQIISTFGNINVECIEDQKLADFDTKSVVVPWNPSFYLKMKQFFPDLSLTKVLSEGMSFPSSIIDFSGFVKFFQELPSLAVYDGLPVLLPTKMIIQNPDQKLCPKNDLDYSWIPRFRSQATDWRTCSGNEMWKLPGRLMGNISITTWSGNIDITNDSKLGCAGNINIKASESGGTLPGYKIGTVNIDSYANKRIYPDPRDLFFDSNFQLRNGGQLQLFTHGSNYSEMLTKPRRSVLPTAANSILKSVGFSFDWYATNYDKFYELYAKNVVLAGNLTDPTLLSSQWVKNQIEQVKQYDAPIMGCTKCISDYLLGIPGVQDLCYATQKLSAFGIEGIHQYGFSKFSPIYENSPRGTFNIETVNFNKISIGDGHAIQNGFTTKQLTGPNMGSINISSNGNLSASIGRNLNILTNAELDQKKHTEISYQYSQEYWDNVLPPILQTAMNLPNQIWSGTFGQIITIEDGKLVIGKSLGPLYETEFCPSGLDLPFPQNQLYVIGQTNKISTTMQGYNECITNITSANIDYGFTLDNCLQYVKNPSKLGTIKMNITTVNGITKTCNDVLQVDNSQMTVNTLSADFGKQSILFNQNTQYKDNTIGMNHANSNCGNQTFNLQWNTSLPLLFPKYYWTNTDTHDIIDGKGYTKSSNFTSYNYHELIEFNILKSISQAKEQYTDYIVNEQTSVSNGSYADGESRNIIINKNYYAGKGISKDIYWESPINSHVFTLNSDTYFEDQENEEYISTNNYQVLLQGNLEKPGMFDKSANYTQKKKNNFSISNTYFVNNQMSFSNISYDKGTDNLISIFNGNAVNTETSGAVNNIIVENGNNTQFAQNNIGFFNGLYSQSSYNSFVLNNGDSDYTVTGQNTQVNEFTINCGNGSNSYSLYNSFFIEDDKLKQTAITNEYSEIEKHTNIGIYNLQNVGKLYKINTGQYVQNASLSAVTNSLKIQHNTGDVPSAVITNPIPLNPTLSIGESYKNYFKEMLSSVKNLFSLSK